MLNGIYSETTLLNQVAAALRSRLPADWSLELSGDQLRRPAGRSQIDAVLTLADPRGEAATITVEAKGRPFEARMVSSLLDRWQRALLPESREGPDAERSPSLMVISPFLGPSVKERLTDAGVSYADATGNMRFVTNRPAVFIESEGAVRNPWRENVSAAFSTGSA